MRVFGAAGYVCIVLCTMFECVTASLIFGFRHRLGYLFVDDEDVVALVSKIAYARNSPAQKPCACTTLSAPGAHLHPMLNFPQNSATGIPWDWLFSLCMAGVACTQQDRITCTTTQNKPLQRLTDIATAKQ